MDLSRTRYTAGQIIRAVAVPVPDSYRHAVEHTAV